MENSLHRQSFDLAYVSRLVLPNPAANVLQTLQMMAELNHQGVAADLFVRDMLITEEQIRKQYAIHSVPFQIRSLNMKKWPAFICHNNSLRPFAYNSAIATNLLFSSRWRTVQGRSKVLFVRSKSEIVYWGTMRFWLPWLRDWVFVCEMHDIPAPGIHANRDKIPRTNSADSDKIVKALEHYDLVLALTEALAEDIRNLSGGRVQPSVLPSATGLERLSAPPLITFPPERIILGYLGTV